MSRTRRATALSGMNSKLTHSDNHSSPYCELRHLGRAARRWMPLACLGILSLGCGAVTDTELFGESNAALSENVGEPCSAGGAVSANEVNVDEQVPGCDPGICVTRGGDPGAAFGEGICTCRCDGPEGTGPLCGCGEGFVCEELIKDFNLGNRHLVGSYCMPSP